MSAVVMHSQGTPRTVAATAASASARHQRQANARRDVSPDHAFERPNKRAKTARHAAPPPAINQRAPSTRAQQRAAPPVLAGAAVWHTPPHGLAREGLQNVRYFASPSITSICSSMMCDTAVVLLFTQGPGPTGQEHDHQLHQQLTFLGPTLLQPAVSACIISGLLLPPFTGFM